MVNSIVKIPFVRRLRIRLLEQPEIEETLLWEQKILIGAVPLVDDHGKLQKLPPLRKGSARENNDRGILYTQQNSYPIICILLPYK